MNDSIKPAFLVALVVVALTAFIGYHKFYRPKQSQVKAIKLVIVQENNDRKAKLELDQKLSEVAELKKRLAPAEEVSWLVKQIVDAANESAVEFDSLVPGGLIRKGDVSIIPIRVKFKASYKQLGMLVDHLESNPYYIRIDSLVVNERVPALKVRLGYVNQKKADMNQYADDGWLIAAVTLSVSTLYIAPLFPDEDQLKANM